MIFLFFFIKELIASETGEICMDQALFTSLNVTKMDLLLQTGFN